MASDSKRATLKDVAREAGVSVGMASRVLGGYGYFSDDTRDKVTAAAVSLDYRPNVVARSLRKGQTQAIGVLVSNIVSFHWTTFVRGVEEAANKRGYQVILGNTQDDPDLERVYLSTLVERNVDGIILSPHPANLEHLGKLIGEGLPMLLIDSGTPDIDAPVINIDDLAGAHRATDYLIGLGHRRIGMVAGAMHLTSAIDRLQGYRDAHRAHGLSEDDELIVPGEYRFDEAYRATRTLISRPDPPSALLICNELMTGAALQCLKDHGIAIPDAMSVVAFDDPAWTSFFNPSLTTVRTPRHRIGTLALETLLAAIDDPGAGVFPATTVETELVVRESCTPPRG